ncbi:MAG TPA: tyrosine-type recombinase/integrase [Candidatus Ornithospirochaeta avicola]|uniref:Tyrosine-type recombinase/integrase n=1 Tax=Candidatus Ornithospirochaeta avicola TaxID=2840896 RepID=A0A9D1TM85_9SPIO|nr:tyrosine-type recombinase/integrase [Candidatus Ornithospirochaeta avicola]
MAHRKEFYLYKRKKSRGAYWYVCYVDRSTGKQGNAKSIDCLKERLGIRDYESVRRRDDAAIIAKRALDEGIIFSRSNISFLDYCDAFWDYDSSEYIRRRNMGRGRGISRGYAMNMLLFLRKHVSLYIDHSLALEDVRTHHLDDILFAMINSESLASGTIQLIVLSFTLPLKEAYRAGLIRENPADRMMKISRKEKVRGCFTRDECEKMLVFLSTNPSFLDSSYSLSIKLALLSGMRSGEIRALNVSDFVPSSYDGYVKIMIRNSYSPFSGIKDTKGGYERACIIPESFKDELFANADEKGILLPSTRGGYMSSPSLRNAFYRLLDEIGIGEDVRRKRNLTFHSLRHTFSTLARDENISQEDRMSVMGHRSRSINDRYTHASDESLLRVSRLAESLLGAEKSAVRGSLLRL